MLKCSVLSTMARVKLVALFLPLLLLAAVACSTAEARTLEGILQSIDGGIDSGEGEVVIVTQEGKTFRLTLVTEVDEYVVPGDFVKPRALERAGEQLPYPVCGISGRDSVTVTE